MRRAIIWPLTTNADIQAYLVSGDEDTFDSILLNELKEHIRSTIQNIQYQNQSNVIADFLEYELEPNGDVFELTRMFIEASDELAAGYDPESVCTWNVRIITDPA